MVIISRQRESPQEHVFFDEKAFEKDTSGKDELEKGRNIIVYLVPKAWRWYYKKYIESLPTS